MAVDPNEGVEEAVPNTGGGDGSVAVSVPSASLACAPKAEKERGDDRTSLPQEESSKEQAVPQLSKNQQKKLKRKQEWEDGREDRKVKRRAKTKEKRQQKRAVRDELVAQGIQPSAPKQRTRPLRVPVTIIMDCDFEDLMTDAEQKSLATQITRCYSDNRKAPFRPWMTISSFKGSLKDRFENLLDRNHESWNGVSFCADDFVQAAEEAKTRMASRSEARVAGALRQDSDDGPVQDDGVGEEHEGELIYLSSDSPDTIHELKPRGIYIIGGLVDKNRHKGLCHKRALDRNIKTAKLPIGEYLNMQSRQVLTTNHVNEIMIKWLELGDWGKAFMHVIPRRKGGMLNEDGDRKEESEGDEEAEAKVQPEQEGDDTHAECPDRKAQPAGMNE